MAMSSEAASRGRILAWQIAVAVIGLGLWHVLTATKILDPFFFATPLGVIERTWRDFASGVIWRHLGVTLLETVLSFAIGALGGVALGFWFARRATAAAVFDPYIKAANALPRVVLAPIFALWFGLGIWSKVALGVSLVFFIVFFNVYQGVREVSPTILANARMMGMSDRQLLRHVYMPSALSWVFSSLHTSVGFALVGAVVGEYLGATAGLGYRIAQAEGVFDVVGVFSGMLVLAAFVVAIDAVVSVIERRLLVWRPESAASASAQG
jgi:NitT/TauT family transport system permease protein